ncbi:CENP-B homolog protein 2-like protein [Tanacetum coccineum]
MQAPNQDNPSLNSKAIARMGSKQLWFAVSQSDNIETVKRLTIIEKAKKFMKDVRIPVEDSPDFTFFYWVAGKFKARYGIKISGLFFRLQPDHSLATMQLEGKKQDNERLTVAICCNEDGSEKLPLWSMGNIAKPSMTMDVVKALIELQNLIKEFGYYRNAMDVEDVLTRQKENVVAQLLTDEEHY